jgi:hypothetical protein
MIFQLLKKKKIKKICLKKLLKFNIIKYVFQYIKILKKNKHLNNNIYSKLYNNYFKNNFNYKNKFFIF